MPLNKKNKKSMDFLSRKFYIDNQGDVFAVILILIIATQMIGFLKPYTKVLYSLNYEVNANTTGLTHYMRTFTTGVKDYGTIFSLTVAWLAVLSVLEEYITDRFIPRLRLSRTKTYECRLAIFSLPYCIIGTLYFGYATAISQKVQLSDIFHMKIHEIFVNMVKSSNTVQMHSKLSILISISYFLAMLIKMYVSKTSAKHANSFIANWIMNLALLFVIYQFKFIDYGVFMLTLYGIPYLLESLTLLSLSVPFLSFYKHFSSKIHFAMLLICVVVSSAFASLMTMIYMKQAYSKKLSIKSVQGILLSSMIVIFYLYELIISCSKTFFKTTPILKVKAQALTSKAKNKSENQPNLKSIPQVVKRLHGKHK